MIYATKGKGPALIYVDEKDLPIYKELQETKQELEKTQQKLNDALKSIYDLDAKVKQVLEIGIKGLITR